jgi:undecaprenyl-diphosphatase
MFAVGLGVSFVTALVVIRGFLRFVQHHSFVPFAWYRLVFGGIVLALVLRHTMP